MHGGYDQPNSSHNGKGKTDYKMKDKVLIHHRTARAIMSKQEDNKFP